MDETYIGGEEPGLRGGRAGGKKVLTCIAVEVREPKGLGRCRMAPLADASGPSLHAFVTDHVEPGAVVITDGWSRIPTSCCPGCTGSPRWPSGGCSAPIRDRWTTRTCRATWTSSCSASTPALPQPRDGVLPGARARRGPRSGALPRHRRRPPAPGSASRAAPGRGHPPSLERPPANRPWRRADRGSSG